MSNRIYGPTLMRSLASLALVALAACGGNQPTGATCPTDSTLTYDNFGKQFMTDYCTECHSNYGTVTGIRKDLVGIDETSAAGPDATNTSMPPSAPYPTAAERMLLGEWIACDAP